MTQYYYLVSSLPLLNFDESPLINSEEFLDSCSGFISSKELDILQELSVVPALEEADNTISEWSCWEVALRNSLGRRRVEAVEDPGIYLRENSDYFSEIEKGIQDAFTKSNPLERENHLDNMRWSKLEDMELGHDFDFKKLCIYKLKLLLCEKRVNRNQKKGSKNYDDTVIAIYGVNPLASTQIEEQGT